MGYQSTAFWRRFRRTISPDTNVYPEQSEFSKSKKCSAYLGGKTALVYRLRLDTIVLLIP